MATVLEWLTRILRIGVGEFLAKLGWRVWAGLVLAVVGLVALLLVITLILVAVLF